MDEAQARIAEAISAVGGTAAGALDHADRPVALGLPNGMAFDMTGEQYVRDWLLPQFCFPLGHRLRHPAQPRRGARQG